MIYTLTMNPSLDYIVHVSAFQTGMVNRSSAEQLYAGGKGINVSLVLHNLGIPSAALGFFAGFTGEKIIAMLKERGISTDFIPLPEGMSRINIKLNAGEETEINGTGPVIPPPYLDALFEKLDMLTDKDILVLAGSIPASVPETLYKTIICRLAQKHTKVIVDASKELLSNVLPYHPFLIKPNVYELAEITGRNLAAKEEIIEAARAVQEQGAVNVLVSMAGDGAVLLDETGKVHYSRPPKGKKINSVGAGDSMVAGFLAGYLEHHSYKKAFLQGLCTGSASAFSQELATKAEVEALMKTFEQ